jgi:subtilisin family serine protease
MRSLLIISSLAFPAAALAQLGLPSVPGLLGDVRGTLARPLGETPLLRDATALVRARVARLRDLVAATPRVLELDPEGNPAVRGELLAVGLDEGAQAAALADGFNVIEAGVIEGAGVPYAQLAVPSGMSLAKALRTLRRIAPAAEISANQLHLPSGGTLGLAAGAAASDAGGDTATLGLIDGGVAASAATGPVEARGFAAGAPAASTHGTAVASLLAGAGAVRGAAPGAALLAADIYGRDPTGGNALALARAFGWLAARGAKVVTVSLVGPANPVVAATIRAVQAKGVIIVAAVGNDGPAAPPAYPASYPGVVAVTGVDARNRPLIEAGRALHLDFAAPGADMLAATPTGAPRAVRGTSFAAPLVAGRLASAGSLAALAAEARDLGPKGPDRMFGRGLVCGECRTLPKRRD